jgi:large subunit ribosomal protein L13
LLRSHFGPGNASRGLLQRSEDKTTVIKTYMAKPGEVQQAWQHFDAEGVVLGRMAARIAVVLQGKHHARYTPHVDTGDFVLVTNASKVMLTGTKADTHLHHWHSGYLGGMREMTSGDMRDRDPARLVRLAVRRMLPKTKLGRAMFSKLKVYAGTEHPHAAQKPIAVDTTPYRRKER